MGSSAYAGGVAAARLRARGVVAVSELASSDLLPAWGAGTLVLAVSATGGSRETLDALGRLPRDADVVALTNTPGSALSDAADHTVDLQAGTEASGVACRSFQHTLGLLLALERHLAGEDLGPLADDVDRAADANEHLLATAPDWLPEVTDLLDGPAGSHLAAPARRLSSAQQGALMLREIPRRAAIGLRGRRLGARRRLPHQEHRLPAPRLRRLRVGRSHPGVDPAAGDQGRLRRR